MVPNTRLKKKSFLVYGLGSSGKSVIKYFKKNNFKNYKVWDDKEKKLLNKYRAIKFKENIKTSKLYCSVSLVLV